MMSFGHVIKRSIVDHGSAIIAGGVAGWTAAVAMTSTGGLAVLIPGITIVLVTFVGVVLVDMIISNDRSDPRLDVQLNDSVLRDLDSIREPGESYEMALRELLDSSNVKAKHDNPLGDVDDLTSPGQSREAVIRELLSVHSKQSE